MPIVFVDYAFKEIEDIQIVTTEGFQSSREAVKFLYHKGRRKIAYINFPRDAQVTRHRCEGYKRGLADCDLPYDPDLVYYPSSSDDIDVRDMGYHGAKALMTANTKADAIMVAADPLAVGAMKYLKQQGIKIPEEVSLVGFDNNEICEIIGPALTTIAQPIKKIGTLAAEILFNKINGIENTQERKVFDGELIQRDST